MVVALRLILFNRTRGTTYAQAYQEVHPLRVLGFVANLPLLQACFTLGVSATAVAADFLARRM